MAAFLAKQMVGSQLSAVKGQIAGDSSNDIDREEEERERLEAIQEAEERRKEKHRKMEEEREFMRQEIRDKYNIKKRDEPCEVRSEIVDHSLNRKKRTDEEIARDDEDDDDFTRIKKMIQSHVNEIRQQLEGRCSLQ